MFASVKSEANNRNMTSKQQRTGASILLLRYLFASLRYFAPSVHTPLVCTRPKATKCHPLINHLHSSYSTVTFVNLSMSAIGFLIQ